MAFAEVEEDLNIGMPGFQIDGKGAFAFSAALVDIAGGVVEDAQHGQDAIGESPCAADVGAGRAHIVDAEADASARLRNFGARFKRVENAVNAVLASAEGSRRTSADWGFRR